MKVQIIKKLFLLLIAFCVSCNFTTISPEVSEESYTIIIEGFDWGPGVNKVVLPLAQTAREINRQDYKVSVERKAEGVEMQAFEASGERMIVHAYVSDGTGNRVMEGKYATLVLYVAPNDILSSPIKYVFNNGRGGNKWIEYNLTVTNHKTNQSWSKEANRIIKGVDRFNLNGHYQHEQGIKLTYASFMPNEVSGKAPLIIWLHGGGEGGTDTSIPLIANRAYNYASDDIQQIFGGAYVLVPQSPTFWMQNKEGKYTRGDVDDIYNEALMGLIRKYVVDNPGIDQDRIYVGGCSNGGYMSLKLIMLYPDYFAAAYISALAYQNQFITDEQIEKIKNIPVWFLHSKDDTTTRPEETVVPLYHRLINAGAGNVHFSYYDHVYDITGLYGGKDYWHFGHFSWIFSHANHADFDFDGSPVKINGKPVTIMEWMAAQSR